MQLPFLFGNYGDVLILQTGTDIITGKDLIEAGLKPGKWFGEAIPAANRAIASGSTKEQALELVRRHAPAAPIELHPVGAAPLFSNIDAATLAERENLDKVVKTMRAVLRTPFTTAGAILPDACPAGSLGTIPVGGVVASEAIHPGMHSADICCSVMISVFDGVSPADLLNSVHAVTHFGPGGRSGARYVGMDPTLRGDIRANPMTAGLIDIADLHFGTQGDGNHFAFVGTLRSNGQTALVTHHGSRGFGAGLYKIGMRLAEKHRRDCSPDTLPVNAWLSTEHTAMYWRALQHVRDWTKANHVWIHDAARMNCPAREKPELVDRFWNEHNFVFMKDGQFYHAKGATPAFDGWADDADPQMRTLLPLNMAEPVLITRGLNNPSALGFSPHGAGRNFSRAAHRAVLAALDGRTDAEIFADETAGIDARFYSGNIDVSELPSAYKNAAEVRRQVESFGLAEVVDEVVPFGCIMAGDFEINAPWRKKKEARSDARA